MKSWRLNWAFEEISKSLNFYKHDQILYSSWKFWFALLVKFVPRLHVSPIRLQLKKGGAFDVKEFMTLFIYKEIFVENCYDYPLLSVDRPIIIDVGANTGLFAIRMKQLYPDSVIYCFEPFPSNYNQLKKNLEQSQFDNYYLFKKGVGGISRKEKLFIHRRNIGGHSIFQEQAGSGSEYIEIGLIDIPGILEYLDENRCNLLKLDCEGAEYEILKSIDKKIACHIEHIVFEPSSLLYDLDELLEHLKNIGYRIEKYKGLYVAFSNYSHEI